MDTPFRAIYHAQTYPCTVFSMVLAMRESAHTPPDYGGRKATNDLLHSLRSLSIVVLIVFFLQQQGGPFSSNRVVLIVLPPATGWS
jgi:hypothetical protein